MPVKQKGIAATRDPVVFDARTRFRGNTRRFIILLASVLLLARSWANGQESTAPFSLERIIELYRNDVPCKRLTALISERGVNFDVTEDVEKRLKSQGICDPAIFEVKKKGLAAHIQAGMSYLDEGAYQKAITEFERAKSIDSTNKQALANLDKAQKASAAEKSLPSGLFSLENIESLLVGAVTPKRVATLIEQRSILCESSQADMARLKRAGADDRLMFAIEKKGFENKTKIARSLELASSYLDQGKYPEAIGEIDKARAICPTNKDVLASVNQASSADKSERALPGGSLGLPHILGLLSGRATSRRAASLIRTRKLDFCALKEGEERKLRDAGADDQVIAAIMEKMSTDCDTQPPPPKLIKEREMIRRKDYLGALPLLDGVLEKNQSNQEAWELRGDALVGLKRLSEAVESYDRANPRNWLTWVKKGRALQGLSQHEEAILAFETALRINPENPETWVFKGDSLFALKRCDQARTGYEKALQLDSELLLKLQDRLDRLKNCGT